MPGLTDAKLRAHRGDPTRITRLWDAHGSGLHLECRPNGSKLWIFRYSFGLKARRLSFGTYPKVSLKEARQRRDDARQHLRDGRDPGVEKRKAKRLQALQSGATVRVVADEWLKDRRAGWTRAYAADVVRAFELHVYPTLGSRPIIDVTPLDLLDVLRAVGARRELARRLRQKCEQVWNYAIVTSRATTNAAAPLKGMLPAPEVTGFAAVSEGELAALLAAVAGYRNVFVTMATWLQLLTATRPGETRGARWEEFDLVTNTWTIPAERMKGRTPHVVPLSRQARAVLDVLQPVSGAGPALFPRRGSTTLSMSLNTVSKVWGQVGFGAYTPHGLRKTFSTAANEHGHRADVIEACLAHVDGTVRGIYNLAEHLTARRALLQWWADRLDHLCAIEAAKPRPAITPWTAVQTPDVPRTVPAST